MSRLRDMVREHNKLRDMVREHKFVRENRPDDDDATLTMLGIAHAVQQRIHNSHLLSAEDIGAMLAHNDKCLRHELMYAMVGDVHSELVILRMRVYSLLRGNMNLTVEAEEAVKEIVKRIGDIIEGLEV